MIEPRVGKVKTGHTTSGFIVIVPRIIIHSYSNCAYLHGYCGKCVNMHIFTHTDVGSFGGKLCKFCPFLYFGRTAVDVLWLHSKSNYISLCKRFRLFYTKNLLFLFYIITFTKHLHQFIYYTHFFIKIIFSLTFFLLFLTYPT